jgi:dipeptidyl aminopeptidase/acylaminoacyl peptidase
VWWQESIPGAQARQVTRTVSEEFAALPWVAPEVVEVPSSHVDRPIYARLYVPPGQAGLDAQGRRPAVVFIHGAGYLQNAHHGWSSYFREFMFHTLLAQRGYVVLDMDYRASAGYGRDWRTAIYRHMGGPEVEDLEDGVRYLVERHGVDPARVGAYGGSYGGFLTLMAMFTRPELFAAGAALRPVTDWAHYNHPYTANILNTPELDPEAYERSSPIEYAAGLAKPLLICTGMLDDNVFFQDSVRLAQRLIELEKTDWEVAMYPVEPHGFREPSGWLDEYRRILALFERHLKP